MGETPKRSPTLAAMARYLEIHEAETNRHSQAFTMIKRMHQLLQTRLVANLQLQS